MAKVPKGREFEKAPAGNHPATCVGVYDIGTHEKEYQGKKYKSHQLRLVEQLVDERTEDGEAMTISGDYTFSANSKNFAKLLKAWIGLDNLDDFEPSTLLLRPGICNVVHKKSLDGKKTYANIETITPPLKGMKLTKHTETPVVFMFEFKQAPAEGFTDSYGEYKEGMNIMSSVTFDPEDFKAVPEYIRKKIAESVEYPIALRNNENGGWDFPSNGKGKASSTKKEPTKKGKK